MKQWRFEVFNRPGFSDVHGSSVLEDIQELGINSVRAVQSAKVFLIEADFDQNFAERLARELLADPVCEQYYIGRSGPPARPGKGDADRGAPQKRRHRPRGRIGHGGNRGYGRQSQQRADRTKVRPARRYQGQPRSTRSPKKSWQTTALRSC